MSEEQDQPRGSDPLAPNVEDKNEKPSQVFEDLQAFNEQYEQYQQSPTDQGSSDTPPASPGTPESADTTGSQPESWESWKDEEKLAAVKELHKKWQESEKKLKQRQSQQQPRDDQGRFVKQDQDVEAAALGRFFQNNPAMLQQLIGQQSQEPDKVQLDPDDVDPFRFFEDGSQENQWLQQQIDERADNKAAQRLEQVVQPLMDRLTLNEMRTRATEEFGIPDDQVDDFLEFLQQPKDQILGDPQTIAQFYKMRSGVSETENQPDTSEESMDLPFDIEELRQMIDTDQQATSPAGEEQHAGDEQKDPRDRFMDDIIDSMGGGFPI